MQKARGIHFSDILKFIIRKKNTFFFFFSPLEFCCGQAWWQKPVIPSTWKTEAGRLQIHCLPEIHSEFKSSLGKKQENNQRCMQLNEWYSTCLPGLQLQSLVQGWEENKKRKKETSFSGDLGNNIIFYQLLSCLAYFLSLENQESHGPNGITFLQMWDKVVRQRQLLQESSITHFNSVCLRNQVIPNDKENQRRIYTFSDWHLSFLPTYTKYQPKMWVFSLRAPAFRTLCISQVPGTPHKIQKTSLHRAQEPRPALPPQSQHKHTGTCTHSSKSNACQDVLETLLTPCLTHVLENLQCLSLRTLYLQNPEHHPSS